MKNNPKDNIILRITALVVLQCFLLTQLGWAGVYSPAYTNLRTIRDSEQAADGNGMSITDQGALAGRLKGQLDLLNQYVYGLKMYNYVELDSDGSLQGAIVDKGASHVIRTLEEIQSIINEAAEGNEELDLLVCTPIRNIPNRMIASINAEHSEDAPARL